MTPAKPDAQPAPRRRRWPFVVVGLVVLLGVLAAAGPTLATPFVRSAVLDGIEQNLDAKATVGELSLAHGAAVNLRDLRIDDRAGRPFARLGSADVTVDVMAALGGRFLVDATVRDFEAHLRKDADGRLNLESILKGRPDDGDDEDDDGKGEGSRDAWPAARVKLDVSGGRVLVHGDDGVAEIRDLALRSDVASLTETIPFELTASVVGPGGPGGGLRVTGGLDLGATPDDGLAAATIDYVIDDLLLGSLLPAAAAFAEIDDLTGTLSGRGEYALDPAALGFSGNSTLTLTGVTVAGAAVGPRRLTVPDVTLKTEGAGGADGLGTQRLDLNAGQALALSVVGGPGYGPAEGGDDVGARLELDGRLGELLELARPFLPLQEGLAFDGALDVGADLRVALGDGGPAGGSVVADVGIDGLSARDAGGAELVPADMRTMTLGLTAGLDAAAGRASVERLQLLAGPVVANGRLAVTGLPSDGGAVDLDALVIEPSSLQLRADLGQLHQALAGLVDLGALALGGQVDVVLEGRAAQGAPTADGTVAVSGLTFRDGAGLSADLQRLDAVCAFAPGGDVLGLDGTLTAAGLRVDGLGAQPLSLDAVEGEYGVRFDPASSALHVDALTLTAPGVHLSGGGLLHLDPDTVGQDGGGQLDMQVHLDPRRIDSAYGALLGGLALGGEPLTGRAMLASDPGAYRAQGILSSNVVELVLPDRPDAPIRQEDLQLVFNLGLTGPEDLEIRSLEYRSASASASVTGSAKLAAAPSANLQLTLNGQLEKLVAEAGNFVALPDTQASGLLDGVFTLAGGGAADWEVDGRTTIESLRAVVPAPDGGPPIVVEDPRFVLDLDSTLGLEPTTVSLAKLGITSSLLRGELSGDLGLADDGAVVADGIAGEFTYVPDALGALLGGLLPFGWSGADSERLTLAVDGRLGGGEGLAALDGATIDVSAGLGRVRIEGLGITGDVDLKFRDRAGALTGAFDVNDGQLTSDLLADLSLGPPRVDLRKADLVSDFLNGGLTGAFVLNEAGDRMRAEGVRGDFTFVPDRVAALLGDLVPVPWTGSQPEQLTLALDGDVDLSDPLSALETARVDVTGGIGRLSVLGFDILGGFGVQAADGLAAIAGDWTVNDGTATLRLGLDARDTPDAATTLSLDLADIGVTQELGGLLASIHPLFVGQGDPQGGMFQGKVNTQVQLEYRAPIVSTLLAELMQGGATDATGQPLALADRLASLPLEPLTGDVSFSVSDGQLAASPLQSQMLSKLGLGTKRDVSIRPVKLRVEDRRVRYAEPWKWTIDGHETSWSGSVGFDQSLDMVWALPITDRLIERYDKLEDLKGEMIELGVTGSASNPDVGLEDVLPQLFEKALKAKVQNPLDDLLGGLGGLGGAGGGSGGDGGSGESEDPAEILERADELWAQGKKDEARPLYKTLRKKYKLTPVYLFNKKRIKDRADD